MSRSHFGSFLFSAALFCVAMFAGTSAHAQTLTDLHDFNPSAGEPSNFTSGSLAQARDGNLYAESRGGGTSGDGTVTKFALTGTPSIIFSFNGTNGLLQTGGMTLGADGSLYGDSQQGGTSGDGVTFKVTPSGTQTVLHNFSNTGDGLGPVNALVLGTDGNFYGTTNSNPETIYKITPTGTLTTIHTLTSAEGFQGGQLIQAADGNLYGGMNMGGANGFGTVFKVTTAGNLTVLHSFNNTDGADGAVGMVQLSNGTLIGAASLGGTSNAGVIYQITSTGTYTVLHNLNGTTDGSLVGVLLAASDGNAYGTAINGGNGNCGTVFKVTPTGQFTVLYTFDGTHGCMPEGYLTQDTNGLLYGITDGGGAHGSGTFFSLGIGAKPFVRLQSTSGKVGSKVGILGQGFSSSSVVKFNGVQATTVTLTGTTFITATVPTGASDGLVTVTTGSTTLKSTQKYIVHDSWTLGTPLPTAVNWPATGVISGKIYVVGGYAGGPPVANNEIYNPANGSWTSGTPLPTAMAQMAGAVVNNILYVFGGSTNGGTPVFNSVWAYNPSSGVWTSKAPMPTARCSAAAVVVNNIIYVIGGFDGGRVSAVEAYNPATDSWTEEDGLLLGKSEISAGVVGSAGAGFTILAADGFSGSDTGDNEAYDVTTNSWSSLASDPAQRNGACSGVINGLLYVSDGNAGNNSPIATNESFSSTKNTWTPLTAMPNTLTDPGSAVINNLLYCIGGGDWAVPPNNTVYNYVQIYQP